MKSHFTSLSRLGRDFETDFGETSDTNHFQTYHETKYSSSFRKRLSLLANVEALSMKFHVGTVNTGTLQKRNEA